MVHIMDKFLKLLSFLKELPLGGKILSLIIVVLLLTILLFFASCGQTVRVTVKDTPNGVSISTTQTKQDSSGTNIQIAPNINFK